MKDYEGLYEVSNTGKVRSLDKYDRCGRFKKGIVLSNCDNGNGYMVVYLKRDTKRKTKCVHRLVAEVFIDNPNNLPEVNHIDGNKQNNHVDNLEWCTTSENIKHAYRIGLNYPRKGVENINAKLTEDDVRYIRKNHKRYDPEYGYAALARRFGVSETVIKYVAWGRKYVTVH